VTVRSLYVQVGERFEPMYIVTLLQSRTARNEILAYHRCFEVWHRDYNGIMGERTSTDSNWLIERSTSWTRLADFVTMNRMRPSISQRGSRLAARW
jgi:hypothetical protein